MTRKQLPSRKLLLELRKVEQAATAAPWKTVKNNHIQLWGGDDGSARIVWAEHTDLFYVPPFRGKEQSNADAFAAVVARNALPMLLEECDELFALVREAAEFITKAPAGESLAAKLKTVIDRRGEGA